MNITNVPTVETGNKRVVAISLQSDKIALLLATKIQKMTIMRSVNQFQISVRLLSLSTVMSARYCFRKIFSTRDHFVVEERTIYFECHPVNDTMTGRTSGQSNLT